MIENKKVFIILVNWNGLLDTIGCLESLIGKQGIVVNVIVLDNASIDSSVQGIVEWARERKIEYCEISDIHASNPAYQKKKLLLISLSSNLGFAGANNIGIQFALNNEADYILLLNNDTVVKPGFLIKLLTTAAIVPDAGIVGGLIRHYGDKHKVWFSGGYISKIRGAFYHEDDECSGQRESGFISGCLMLIPAGIFHKVGFFDENYFLNVEDVDFSLRVREAGYRLIVNCDAEIYHKVSSSIGGLYSSMNQYYFHRNRMLFFSKQLRGFKKIVFFTFQFIFAIPAWLVIQLVKGNMESVKGAILGYADYFRGNFGKSRYF